MSRNEYEAIRQQHRPARIKVLMVAESPPPAPDVQSSRQFYYTDRVRRDDRLVVNTMKALYADAADLTEAELEADKAAWLHRFAADGWYMIEALEQSQAHEVTKKQRQEQIQVVLPRLIERVRALAEPGTKLILVKSNVFVTAAEPLREAGFYVPQTALLDYPGHFNQRAYREKLAKLARA